MLSVFFIFSVKMTLTEQSDTSKWSRRTWKITNLWNPCCEWAFVYSFVNMLLVLYCLCWICDMLNKIVLWKAFQLGYIPYYFWQQANQGSSFKRDRNYSLSPKGSWTHSFDNFCLAMWFFFFFCVIVVPIPMIDCKCNIKKFTIPFIILESEKCLFLRN